MSELVKLAKEALRQQRQSSPASEASAPLRSGDTIATRPAYQPGDWVEWQSPALFAQQGEVLAIYPDGTFEVFHPLAETLCRLPVAWVTRILKGPTSTIPEEPIS
jgi:hypothetical protein